MRKLLTLFLVAVLAISCTDKYQSNLDKMGAAFKTHIEDLAFKENGTVTFHEFQPISYDTVSTLTIDTLNRLGLNSKFTELNEYAELLSKKIDGEIKLLRLYKGLDSDLTKIQGQDVQESLDKKELILDKMKEIMYEDSLLNEKMQETKGHGSLYRARIFIKATMNAQGQSENIMDTVEVFFSPELKFMQLNDYSRFDVREIVK